MEFDKLVFGRFGAQEFDRFGAEDSLADLVPIIITRWCKICQRFGLVFIKTESSAPNLPNYYIFFAKPELAKSMN